MLHACIALSRHGIRHGPLRLHDCNNDHGLYTGKMVAVVLQNQVATDGMTVKSEKRQAI